MSRGLSAPTLTAASAAHVRPIVFVKLELDSGTLYLHNAVGTYTWGSQTWTGVGALGSIGEIEEGLDLSPYAVALGLNALDPSLVTVATTEEVFNRRVTIYIGLLDDNGALVADPHERWSGSGDSMSIRLGGEDGIALNCENDFRFFDQANGSRFTDEDQQRRYPGDLFFEFLPQMIDAKVFWGQGGSPTVVGQLGGRMNGGASNPSPPSDGRQRNQPRRGG